MASQQLTKDPNANATLNGGGSAPAATPAAKQTNDPFDVGPPTSAADDKTAAPAATPSNTAAPRSNQAKTSSSQPSSPPAATGSTGVRKVSVIRHIRSDEQIHNNPFDGYINCIYNVSLALLNWKAVKQLEGSSQQDVKLTASDYTVFASTAEARASVNYEGDYYNIKTFSFTNFVGHMPQNPMVASIMDGKMKIMQPYGFSMREDLDMMAEKGEYKLLNPLNYIYRLEIWFSGYKPTGEHVQNIEIPVHADKTLKSIVYYLTVTAVEAKVTSTGTEYDLSFQTAAHLALRAEMTMMHKDNMGALKGGSTVNYAKGSKFEDFIKNLAEALHRQVLSDTQNHVNIDYQFFGPDWLFDATFEEGGKVDFSKAVSFQPNTGSHAYSGANMDILTLLNNVMDQLTLVRQLHLREDDTTFKEPGCLWNVRTNISKVDQPKREPIGNYGTYEFQYIIEPVLSFRSRMTETEQRNEKTIYENQEKRAKAMKDLGMIIRVYDYLFTEDNSEIIDFQFLYKNFYYEAYPYPAAVTDIGSLGSNTNNTPYPNVPKPKGETSPPAVQFVVESTPGTVFEQLRIPVPSPSTSGQFKPESKQGGMQRHTLLPTVQSMTATEQNLQKYQRAKEQYMRFDMINAQITIRFDPVWLLNPYMSGGDFTAEVPTGQRKGGIFVYAHADRVVFIKAYQPNQKNYMNSDFRNVSPRRAPILGGYYQVVQAVSEFSGGRFTQKLNMFKYPHMNYFNTDNTGSGTIKTDSATTAQPSAAPAAAATQPDPKKGLT